MSLIYKTLFEVKLMHEYFLTREDGSSVFAAASQQDRLQFLMEEFANAKKGIGEDISFAFPEALSTLYKDHQLRLLPSYSGCRVVVRVTAHNLPGNMIAYKPLTALPDDLHIFIGVMRKKNHLDAYTNARVSREIPATYYVSNNTVVTPRTFPFLTNAIPAVDSAAVYEQGELSISAGGQVQAFFLQSGMDQWETKPGTGFLNETDRLLVPTRFRYQSGKRPGPDQVSWVLLDASGNTTAQMDTGAGSSPIKELFLDFSGSVRTIPAGKAFQLEDFFYTLEISENGGPGRPYRLLFSDVLIAENPWAVLDIGVSAGEAPFQLLAADGYLFSRRDASGTLTPAPVFEIPVTSRFAFWRFRNYHGHELDVSAPLSDFVNKEQSALVTRKPRALAKHWFNLKNLVPPGSVYVPNPDSEQLIPESDRRIFYDIRVPQSALFPVVP